MKTGRESDAVQCTVPCFGGFLLRGCPIIGRGRTLRYVQNVFGGGEEKGRKGVKGSEGEGWNRLSNTTQCAARGA